ncbi:MAG: hypothetical protein AAB019_08545 [Planctomycetota bacterium]|mgnify:CR=1 FL=1
MMNCNRCVNEIPEKDLATRRAYQTKDGRTFCASCTAFLIAQQKAAKAKAQAGQSQSASAQPVPANPVQKQPTVQAITRTRKPAQPPVAAEAADEAPAAPERRSKVSQMSRAKYKTAAASEISAGTADLKKSKARKNLLILLGMAAAIIGLIGIFIFVQMAKAKEEKQDETISRLRSKAKETYLKADQVSEASDPKAMDASLELVEKAVQSFEDYAKEIDQYDANAKTIKTHQENIKNLEKKIIERKGRIAQEDALQRTLEDVESKVANPDTIESVFKNIEELKKKGKELEFSNDFFSRVEKIEKKGQEPYVKKLLANAKKFREEKPTDYDMARSKFVEVLKRARDLELYLRQENEIAVAGEKQAKEPDNKPVNEISIKQIQESIAQVEKNVEECLEQIKQIGQAKDAAENPPEEWRDMLDAKYSKLWKKDGTFEASDGSDNSLVVTVGKKKAGEASIYYIGSEYVWEDVTIEIEFTIVEGNGFTVLGRYYNESYQPGQGHMPTFGAPWGFSFDVQKEDAGSGARYARTLEAIGGRLKIIADDLNPDDKNNNKNIQDPRFSKMGGVGMDFKPNSKVIIHKFRIKVDK